MHPGSLLARHPRLCAALFSSQHAFTSTSPIFVIAGLNIALPTAITTATALSIRSAAHAAGLPALFKSSWDKANRTAPTSHRGPGPVRAALSLARARRASGLPLITDVHEPAHCARAARFADALQIPSLLCRQTDLLAAAAATRLPLNLKKGQFASPAVMRGAAAKAGPAPRILTERGACHGPAALVVDVPALRALRPHGAVVLDATHAAQVPPHGRMAASGGCLAAVRDLARAGVAAGVDGVFLEVHPDPRNAPVDGGVQLPVDELAPLLRELAEIARASRARDEP